MGIHKVIVKKAVTELICRLTAHCPGEMATTGLLWRHSEWAQRADDVATRTEKVHRARCEDLKSLRRAVSGLRLKRLDVVEDEGRKVAKCAREVTSACLSEEEVAPLATMGRSHCRAGATMKFKPP